jgi:RNA polymerase sigma-70 factor, ECF subfamily
MQAEIHPIKGVLDDAELVHRIGLRDEAAFEDLMRRHNAALFRAARSILHDDSDAEDALQEAYLAAYTHIKSFRGESSVLTWLTRIVINQALGRRRSRIRDRIVVPFGDQPGALAHEQEAIEDSGETPENAAVRDDMRRLLESKVDSLPDVFRAVYVLREVNEMSVEETAASLEIPEATVRSRLFRARGLLRESLARELDMAAGEMFTFGAERCDRLVARVLSQFRTLPS